MAKKRTRTKTPKRVSTLKHGAASRPNIPTAEFEAVLDPVDQEPVRVAFERRNRDLDPQFVWRGKDVSGPAELMVQAPPLFIQEKVHPKVLVDDLERETRRRRAEAEEEAGQPDLFSDFNGLPSGDARTEFYRHDANWSNRMILGDSLQVMASLAEREGLRGKVQCIYMDPPYGIKFNSNFQWSTTSRDVKDGKAEHISREPEQVKAFRDTWRDGIHSYLTYLRDRLTVARELLSESGSIFVQIGDENVHRVRALMDEVFGHENYASLIYFLKTTGKGSGFLDSSGDYILWYAKNAEASKVRALFRFRTEQTLEEQYNMASIDNCQYRRLTKRELRTPSLIPTSDRRFMPSSIYSDSGGATTAFTYTYENRSFVPLRGYFWRTTKDGLNRLDKAARLCAVGNYIRYRMYGDDYPIVRVTNYWDDVRAGGFGDAKTYVVQTARDVVERCVLMATDVRLRHHRLRCRTMGAPLDHHRYLPRRPRARPRPHHGCPLSVVLAGRQPRGPAQGGRDQPHRPVRSSHARRRPSRLRLRARPARHAQVHRQQHGDRRHLGALAGDPGAAARGSERRARSGLG